MRQRPLAFVTYKLLRTREFVTNSAVPLYHSVAITVNVMFIKHARGPPSVPTRQFAVFIHKMQIINEDVARHVPTPRVRAQRRRAAIFQQR